MQVAKLERELSAIVAEGFPYIPAPGPAVESFLGPRLLSLGELERTRDQLATRVQEYRRRVDKRAEHELRAHELLRRMKLEPARYQYVRLPVNDLGQGGCGVWEVRPGQAELRTPRRGNRSAPWALRARRRRAGGWSWSSTAASRRGLRLLVVDDLLSVQVIDRSLHDG